MTIRPPLRNGANRRSANPLVRGVRRGRSAAVLSRSSSARLNALELASTPLGRATAGPLDTAALRQRRHHQAAFDSNPLTRKTRRATPGGHWPFAEVSIRHKATMQVSSGVFRFSEFSRPGCREAVRAESPQTSNHKTKQKKQCP
jgi:hypothetical protein